jgi:hypothetical protein
VNRAIAAISNVEAAMAAGPARQRAGQWLQHGTAEDAHQHQHQAGERQVGMTQRCVLETRNRLVGEAYDEQSHPTENLSVAVGVDFMKSRRRE